MLVDFYDLLNQVNGPAAAHSIITIGYLANFKLLLKKNNNYIGNVKQHLIIHNNNKLLLYAKLDKIIRLKKSLPVLVIILLLKIAIDYHKPTGFNRFIFITRTHRL